MKRATSRSTNSRSRCRRFPIPAKGTVPPWLVDRMFRNLLIDVTGNTHRAEICIDKLYSPDSPTGRLGLVEFRSFEMPPHARMSLAQQLLLRALIVMFWEKPYRQKLVRWGTALHDRFMLPHFVWADFASIIDDLQARPVCRSSSTGSGRTTSSASRASARSRARDVEIELRQALEPWHVLGEEGVAGGTARYVDSRSSGCRCKVRGLTGDRFVVTCNGRTVPLTPTGTAGEAVAGVRYRAWGPPSALHPTIPTACAADVRHRRYLDRRARWPAAAITSSHPGGRSLEMFPVNAYEAEGRRLARFEAHRPHGRARCSRSPATDQRRLPADARPAAQD